MTGFRNFIKFIVTSRPISFVSVCMIGTAAVIFAGCLYGMASFILSLAAFHVSYETIVVPAVAVRFFGLGRAVLAYGERYVSHNETFKILQKLRVHVYDQWIPALPDYLHVRERGESLSVAVSDVENLQDGLLRVIYPVLISVLVGLLGILFAAGLHPFFAVAFGLLYFPLAIAFFAVIFSYASRRNRTAAEKKQKLYQEYIELSSGWNDIKSNSCEAAKKQRFLNILQENSNAQKDNAQAAAFTDSASSLYLGLCTAVLFCMIAYLCFKGAVNWVYLAAVVIGFSYLLETVSQAFVVSARFEKVRQSSARVFEQEKAKDGKRYASENCFPETPRQITADHISFRYPGRKDTVRDLSITLEPGSMTILTGRSGAGKSTVVQLLLGFLKPDSGTIHADQRSLAEISQGEWMKLFSATDQSPYFFNDTIRENLLLYQNGIEEVSEGRMNKILADVNLLELMKALPDGLDTLICESGINLSGGEIKRLDIARALLKDAPFFLFDEPTAELDAINEKIIFELIFKLAEAKGILLITHRTGIDFQMLNQNKIKIKEVRL